MLRMDEVHAVFTLTEQPAQQERPIDPAEEESNPDRRDQAGLLRGSSVYKET